MGSIKDKSTEFGNRYLKFENNGDTGEALAVKVEWAAWRDTLSGKDKDDCVEAFTDAITPLSEAAKTLLVEKRAGNA